MPSELERGAGNAERGGGATSNGQLREVDPVGGANSQAGNDGLKAEARALESNQGGRRLADASKGASDSRAVGGRGARAVAKVHGHSVVDRRVGHLPGNLDLDAARHGRREDEPSSAEAAHDSGSGRG